MKCRLRIKAFVASVIVVIVTTGLPVGQLPRAHAQDMAQNYAEDNAPESAFREEIDRFRTVRDRNQARQDGNSLSFGQPDSENIDIFDGPREGPERNGRANSIDTLNNPRLFSDDPIRPAGLESRSEDFSRFEARGGELRQSDLTIERGRNENLLADNSNEQQNGSDGQRENARERQSEYGDPFAAEQRGQRQQADFEDDFLAAERAMEEGAPLEDLTAEDNEEDVDRAATSRQATTTRRRRNLRSGQDLTEASNRQNANARQALTNNDQDLQADVNDITGSIRPRRMEDPYAAEGQRVGSFLFFPEVTITGQYSDNPTASPTNSPGDNAIEMRPGFLLRSDWSRHGLELGGQLTKSYYEELTSENVEEWFLRANGRIDIRRNHYFELGGRIEQLQDDRGDIDTVSTDAELATYQVMSLSALYNYEWNRTTLRLSGNLADYDYDDTVNSLAVTVNNDDLDYLESAAAARLSYTFHPGLYVFTEGAYVSRDYDSQFDDLGFERSSEGYTIRAGFIYDLTAKLRLEASAGQQWLNADDNRFADLEEFVYSAALTYRPSVKTSITLATEREIEGTDIDGGVGVLQTQYSLALGHYFRPHIFLSTSLNFLEEAYEGIDIEQDTLTATVAVQYIFNRHARLIASYQFSDVESNNGGDYQENLFRLGLNLRP